MKPILFNTEMVKGILEGNKTVTRRPLRGRLPCQIGDILYVRETWGLVDGSDYGTSNFYAYKADEQTNQFLSKWHPSIHMPKEAARIFLRVTDVWIEKLMDITEEQAIKEGFINTYGFIRSPDNEYAVPPHTARERFISAFQKMYPGCKWVRAIEFERCEKPEEES